jgi:hypothetical protein
MAQQADGRDSCDGTFRDAHDRQETCLAACRPPSRRRTTLVRRSKSPTGMEIVRATFRTRSAMVVGGPC